MKKLFSLTLLMISTTLFSQESLVRNQPSLWMNNTQLQQLRINLKGPNFKSLSWLTLKKVADKYLLEQVEIPTRGGNWEQYYISPITGNTLNRGKQIGDWRWEHSDSKTMKKFLGDSTLIDKDYDGVVIGFIHSTWALATVELGLAYQITKNTSYLDVSKKVLLKYAEIYPTLPERTRSNGKLAAAGSGKIQVQDLNESQWLVNIAEGADLIWDKFSDTERKLITDNLLLPACEVVMNRNPDITNIQCWRNAAVGSVGFLVNNKELIKYAMGGATGFDAQIKEGFNGDGITKDLATSYQFFAMQPIVLLAQSAINHNYPVDILPMHKMFSSPIKMSNAKLMLPPFNDSRPTSLRDVAYLYEWANTKFNDPSFYEVLLSKNRRLSAIENNYQFIGWNLLFGGNAPYKPIPHKVASINFDSSGVALLSKGNGDANLSCYLKYTNQMQNLRHHHNAQLDMAIMKGDQNIVITPGNMNYASSLSDGWYRSAIAHNTVVYNGKAQRRCSAKCLAFGTDNGVDYVVTQTTNFYIHSAVFLRTMAILNENTVLVVDQFRSAQPEPSHFDLSYHQAGIWEEDMKGEIWNAPDSVGYRYLTDARISKDKKDFYLKTNLSNGIKIIASGTTSTPVGLVTGYGVPHVNTKIPFAMFRVDSKGSEAITIAYCISTNGKKYKVELEPNTNKKTFLSKLHLQEENGIKMSIVINPDKENIGDINNPNTKIFDIK